MMSSTFDISVIILFSHKDEKFEQALRSAEFAKEIIAVENNQIDDFSQIRNQALKKATQEWVFFLDSDEVIAPESVSEIEKIIQTNLLAGVLVKRQDVFYDQIIKYGEVGKMKLLRMGKRDKMIWERPVHEIAKINGSVGNSTIRIVHHAHDSVDDFLMAITNYAAIEAKYRADLNKDVNFLSLIMFPVGKFMQNYVFKKGFLDGWRGVIYALMMSLHSFSVRVFQYELKFKKNHDQTL